MIQKFVDRFMAAEKPIFKERPGSYEDIFQRVIELISTDEYGDPDPKRIHKIDHGDYQGTLLFIVAGNGYQPSNYWSTMVSYGSCSGCDTLQALEENQWYEGVDRYDESECKDGVLNQNTQQLYWTEALHMVQGLKEI